MGVCAELRPPARDPGQAPLLKLPPGWALRWELVVGTASPRTGTVPARTDPPLPWDGGSPPLVPAPVPDARDAELLLRLVNIVPEEDIDFGPPIVLELHRQPPTGPEGTEPLVRARAASSNWFCVLLYSLLHLSSGLVLTCPCAVPPLSVPQCIVLEAGDVFSNAGFYDSAFVVDAALAALEGGAVLSEELVNRVIRQAPGTFEATLDITVTRAWLRANWGLFWVGGELSAELPQGWEVEWRVINGRLASDAVGPGTGPAGELLRLQLPQVSTTDDGAIAVEVRLVCRESGREAEVGPVHIDILRPPRPVLVRPGQ